LKVAWPSNLFSVYTIDLTPPKNILGNDAKHPIDGSLILPKLVSQHGILARRSQRTYAFSHLTFQEYYTSKYIIDNGLTDELISHMSDSRWHEVFLLAANHL
jgi:predicted NACHT family NTPase